MRLSAILIALALLPCGIGAIHAEPPSTGGTTSADPKFQVRVSLTSFVIPLEKIYDWMPGLEDAATTKETVEKLQAAVQRKEASINGIAYLQCLDGCKCTSETIREERYPTEYELSPIPQAEAKENQKLLVDENLSQPTAFDTRNVGLTLEIEVSVKENGQSVELNLVPQRVVLAEVRDWNFAAGSDRKVEAKQPIFLTRKTVSNVRVANGGYSLVGVHLFEEPTRQVELHVIKVSAFPIK